MDIEKLFMVREKSDKALLIELKHNISNLVQEKKINMLEFTYIMNFIKNNCSIVNISWLLEIFNRLQDSKLNKLLISCFNIISIKEDQIFLNQESINLLFEKSNMKYTKDQLQVISDVITFLPNFKDRSYGLYGYAGTGKTTICVELIGTLALNKYVKSIALTAPTNKAVNVLKSKFLPFLQRMAKDILKLSIDNSEDILDYLYEFGIKIDFITIHRLLNYESDMNIEGDRVFIRKGKSKIKDYELVIVDECSMVPLNMITTIFNEIKDFNVGDNYQKTPKIIFCGDKAQLPPVNDKVSALFIKNKEELKLRDFINQIKTQEKLPDSEYESKLNNLIKDILAMKSYTMTEIVRNKITNVTNICNNIRKWVDKEIDRPTPRKYQGEGVYIYKLEKNKSKTESDWFKKYVQYINDEDLSHNSNIILTWTNRQTDEYNNTVRKIMYHKEKIEKYEVGDILMLRDFYNIEGKTQETKEVKKKKGKYMNCDNIVFYTSEQIKIMDLEVINKSCNEFIDKLDLPEKLSHAQKTDIEKKVKVAVTTINKETSRKYKVWKCYVQKLSETKINNIPETYCVHVLHDDDIGAYNREKEFIANVIKKLRSLLLKTYKDIMNVIDNRVIKILWKQWSKIIVEPFAQVDYAVSCSSHRSQGSTYYNVFIDVDDILNNPNSNEGRRCLYTALTRSSNEIHLLIP
jgi:hypothetical protein